MASVYDYRKFAVLYVDDETQSLKYFEKAFGKDFRVLTAPSVAEGLELLRAHAGNVGLVLTDQRMPDRTGTDLLGEVRRTYPRVVRMLTTAYSDIDDAIEAVNEGAIYRYVVKPWNVRELRGTLLRAMEFFLVQRERDLLLGQKLHVLQRLVMTDRIRSLAVLAAGLSHHVRNSMTALKTFMDLAPEKLAAEVAEAGAKDPAFWTDQWGMAQRETQRVLQMVQAVAETVSPPEFRFADEVELDRLINRGVEEASAADGHQGTVVVEVVKGMPRVKVDAEMANRLVRILALKAIRLNRPGGRLVVRATDGAQLWGARGIRVMFSGEGPAWGDEQVRALFAAFAPAKDEPGDLGLDLLSAFFIAYHHGGDIVVHKSAPLGPGFELTLPFSPEDVHRPELQYDLLERLFLRFETAGEPVA
jgi:two-component system probable response regulator PhcQ